MIAISHRPAYFDKTAEEKTLFTRLPPFIPGKSSASWNLLPAKKSAPAAFAAETPAYVRGSTLLRIDGLTGGP